MQVKTPIRNNNEKFRSFKSKENIHKKKVGDWNYLPDSLISAAELSDNYVSKFTSLLRARD